MTTAPPRISLQAELIGLGLRWFVKRSGHRESLGHARHRFQAMEALIPRPPRNVITTQVDAGGVRADIVATPNSRPDRHVLYLHGGAYRVGSPTTYRHFTWRIAAAAQARALVPDYRLAPEHPFPAALDDAVASYRWLLDHSAGGSQLMVIGDSAGGGLALALLLKLRDDGIALPAAAVALSPWTDLALTGASLAANEKSDSMVNADDIPRFAKDYLAGADPHDPYASPLYGDPSGLPPTLIQASGGEVLRDDAVRMADSMRRAGCDVELQIWPGMAHTWQLLAPFVPEARRAIEAIRVFLEQRVPVAAPSF